MKIVIIRNYKLCKFGTKFKQDYKGDLFCHQITLLQLVWQQFRMAEEGYLMESDPAVLRFHSSLSLDRVQFPSGEVSGGKTPLELGIMRLLPRTSPKMRGIQQVLEFFLTYNVRMGHIFGHN
jgi:hypothetical protein